MHCRSFSMLILFLLTTPALFAEPPEALVKKSQAVLAQLDGTIAVPGLKGPVEVLRDRWGVPHIYAKNADDLFFAQGFVVAQDRLFQIDLWRRVAIGETAEVLGKAGIEGDRFARLMKYRGDMEAEWASYSPDTRQIATAFARGINAYIDRVGDRLPVEFTLLGHKPGKWQPEDILGRMSGIIMTSNFRNELSRAELVAVVGAEKARQLAPTDPVRPYGPVQGLDLTGVDRSILAGFNLATRTSLFDKPGSASNNWAIDGSLSASGKPLLASDPHRLIMVPSLRYLVHLNGPGWNVIGAGEPGLPGVALGHNERIAWGITIVGTDQSDFYIEETNPQDPTQYKAGDGWEKMKVIREKVTVKGEPQPVEVVLRFTRHGPVIHQDAKRNRAYAIRWVGQEPGTAAYLGNLAVGRVGNAKEFRDSLKSWKVPALNVMYADVDGTIGWVAAGLTPVRKGYDGLLPVPGASGAYEWQGFLKVPDYPQSFNPPTHWLATANHNILYPGYSHQISYEWAPIYRFARIKQRLEAKKKFDLEDMKSIQHEVTSLPGQALVRLIKTVKFDDPALEPFVKLLAEWDGVLSVESRAGPLFAVWQNELLTEFFRPHVPERSLEYVRGGRGFELMIAALEKPEAQWFGDKPQAGRDQLLRQTLARAVAKVKERLGDNPNQWSWGKLHTTPLVHPLAALAPEYAKAFNLDSVPYPGDGNTPNNGRYNDRYQKIHGASYRQVFDLSDWDKGMATSAPGESGQLGSPHYADLLPLWAKAEYFPLAYSRKKVEEVTAHRLVLKPGK